MRSKLFALFLLALCWLPAKAHATACTAGCVQFVDGSVFSGTTLTLTLTSVGTGNAIHGAVCFDATAISSIVTNSVASAVGATKPNGGGKTCALYAAQNITGGTANVVITFTTACGNCTTHGEEWHGDATTGTSLDAMNGTYTSGASSSVPSGSFTTTNPSDVIESIYFQPENVVPATIPTGHAVATADTTNGWFSSYQLVSSAGAQNPTWTSGVGAFDNTNLAGGFEQSGGGGGAVVHTRLTKDVGQ